MCLQNTSPKDFTECVFAYTSFSHQQIIVFPFKKRKTGSVTKDALISDYSLVFAFFNTPLWLVLCFREAEEGLDLGVLNQGPTSSQFNPRLLI